MNDEYSLFIKKVQDMIIYIDGMVMHFPKHQKYLMANKIRSLSNDLLELGITANKKLIKKTTLTELNIKHESLRMYINIAFKLRYINLHKHKTSTILVDEIGRMIGAWIKSEQKTG